MTPTAFPSVLPPPTAARPAGQPWDLDSAARFLGVCRKTLERYVRLDQVAVIRLGRRVLIADDELRRVARFGLPAVGRPVVLARG